LWYQAAAVTVFQIPQGARMATLTLGTKAIWECRLTAFAI